MQVKISTVFVSQSRNARRRLDRQCPPRHFAQFRAGEGRPIIGEADEALIEGGVPQRREQQAVVDIKALFIGALGPWHDMRGAQQRRLRNAGERATAAPVVHQGIAENVLADALDDQPLGLGRLRQGGDLGAKARKRRVRQADG
jgi:hypothetical protein